MRVDDQMEADLRTLIRADFASYPGKRTNEPLRPRKRHAADACRHAQRPEDLSWTMFGKRWVGDRNSCGQRLREALEVN
jgi:hypothetical protein